MWNIQILNRFLRIWGVFYFKLTEMYWINMRVKLTVVNRLKKSSIYRVEGQTKGFILFCTRFWINSALDIKINFIKGILCTIFIWTNSIDGNKALDIWLPFEVNRWNIIVKNNCTHILVSIRINVHFASQKIYVNIAKKMGYYAMLFIF